MDQLEIEKIEKALKSATPGPWQIVDGDVDGPDSGYGELRVATVSNNARYENDKNAFLIANAPTWIQQLLDEIDRQEMRYQTFARSAIENIQLRDKTIASLEKRLRMRLIDEGSL